MKLRAFNFELQKEKKNPNTKPLILQQHQAFEITSDISDKIAIYTDGSNDDEKIATGAVYGQEVIYFVYYLLYFYFPTEAKTILPTLK